MTTASATGTAGFITGLNLCGTPATIVASVVTFEVEATHGAFAGRTIATGVGVNELTMWPAAPPHWVHFPNSVAFPITNPNVEETLPGWTRHSRQIEAWGNASEPAQAWISHVRAVLAEVPA